MYSARRPGPAHSELARSELARSELARSELARSELARSELAHSGLAPADLVPRDLASRGRPDRPPPGNRTAASTVVRIRSSRSMQSVKCAALVVPASATTIAPSANSA